jgi:hypothetical protein
MTTKAVGKVKIVVEEPERPTMTKERFIELAERHIDTRRDAQAELFRVETRTLQRWIAGTSPVPRAVEIVLEVMEASSKWPVRYQIDKAAIEFILEQASERKVKPRAKAKPAKSSRSS